MARVLGVCTLVALLLFLIGTPPAESACCYFAAKDKDILQPAQKAFITWDPKEKVETLHGAAEVRGQRPGLRHGHPHAEPAQAGRDAARLLQGTGRLHHPQETRVPPVQAAAPAGVPWVSAGSAPQAGARATPRKPQSTHGEGAGGRHRRLAGLQDHHRRAGRRPVHLAQGQQVQLRRR